MRLRHVLLTCAVLPFATVATQAASLQTAAARRPEATPTAAPKRSTLTPAEMAATRASVLRMVDQVDMSYQQFTLSNGLRVMVRTDRRAPVVNVGMWYDVGSKHEPEGRSGFAHLFEHLMFNGSENVPGDYLPYLMRVGAAVNGSTSRDRTNYYQVVPTQALDRALFMESDRMGHLLGALDQASLDEQRGVVQNEKRNGSNQPTAVINDMQRAALFPKTHPYGHSIIGSMKDLNAADLEDVRRFFKAHYGPNNALLILAGDIDLSTAKRLVTKYFGGIPSGPRNVRPDARPVMLAKTLQQTATAPITSPIIVRAWPVPGADSKESWELDGVAEAMGGTPESPLQRRLVRDEKLFQNIKVGNGSAAQAGEFEIYAQVRPGVDAKVAAAALDREIALFLQQGPSDDLLTRWVARYGYRFAKQMSLVDPLASSMGENAMVDGNPLLARDSMRFYATLTPAMAKAAARKWLSRPRWELTVVPGPRIVPEDDAGIDGSAASATPAVAPAAGPAAPAAAPTPATPKTGNRGPIPDVGPPSDPTFPAVERVTLANGIPVLFARAPSSPYTLLSMSIDGGQLNEPADQTGTMAIMYPLMAKGFGGMDEDRIREILDLTGITLRAGASAENSSVTLETPDVNLERGLGLLQQMVTTPSFPTDIVERRKREALDQRASTRLSPGVLMRQEMMPLVDAGSPYLRNELYGDGKVLRGLDRAKILASYQRWVRPEHAKIALVSDKPLAELLPLLNRTIGSWRATGTAQPIEPVAYVPKPGTPQIVLIDLPGAVQASIAGGQRVTTTDRDPDEALDLASKVLGADFTSRINMNLRENKHWTYGTYGSFSQRPYSSGYSVQATVQQDKAGPAIAELIKEVRGITGDRPITDGEFDVAKSAMLGKLPTEYSENYGILGGLIGIQKYGRPDSYPGQVGARVRAVSRSDAEAALKAQIDPAKWVWTIIGNAAIIRPQLDALGLPVRVVKAADVLPPL
ncbi:MAG TPA: pitrilysin family protein [Sphingomonas sp.]|nr:pitrilysin family protein [Sphingomonas sp.]